MLWWTWEIFKLFLFMMWPPNVVEFIRTWRRPLNGTGMGPGLYRLFLPIYFFAAFFAVCVDLAIVVTVVVLLSHVSVSFHG